MTEILIIFACVLAATYGPAILINARYKSFFLFSGVEASVLAALLCWTLYLLSRAGEHFFGKIGVYINIFTAYSALIGFEIEQFISYADHFANKGSFNFLWWEYLSNLFNLDFGAALLNFPVLIILFACLLSILMFNSKNIVTSIADTGMMFILPAVILLFFIVPYNPSSEGKVLFSNMMIVYLFLRTAMLPLIDYSILSE